MAQEGDGFARAALLLAILYLTFLAVVLLYPFNFSSPFVTSKNSVRWLDKDRGVGFGPLPGMLIGAGPPDALFRTLRAAKGLTVELWFSSASSEQRGPARIISYSLNPWERNFTLGQSGKNLIIRLRTTATDPNGMPGAAATEVIEPGKMQHVAVTYDFASERIYVDGRLVKDVARQGGFDNWNPSCLLAFGNEVGGGRAWDGTISYAAIYGRALPGATVAARHAAGYVLRSTATPAGLAVSYDFGAGSQGEKRPPGVAGSGLAVPGLAAPARVPAGARLFFLRTGGRTLYQVTSAWDLARNVILFVPLGVLGFVLAGRGRSTAAGVAAVVVGAALVSASFEALQFFIEFRTSSFLDVITNTLGAFVGAIGSRILWPGRFSALRVQ